ncbi:MAG: GAF domain-containing protein [Chloroflexi bacterium]|nr:GAF domain-containing protein [Chloroflexota bacterium]
MAKQGKHRKTLHVTSDLDAARSAPPPSETEARLQQRHDQLVALLGVIHELSSSLDTQTILDSIVRRALQLLNADEGTIYLLDSSGQELQPIVAIGEFAAETLAAPVKVGEGITGYVAQTRIGEIVNHAERDPRAKHIPGTPGGEPESLLSAPLLFQDRLIGVITLRRLGEREFELGDLDFLTGLADHAAVALENARMLKEARDRSADLATLHDINLDIASLLVTQKLFEKITRHAAKLLGTEGSTIALYDAGTEEVELVSAYGPDVQFIGTRLKVGEGLDGKVVQTGQPIAVEDYATWNGRSPQFAEAVFGSILAVPMEWQGQVIGVLEAQALRKKRAFSEEEVSLARLLAAQAAVALQNARLLEQTHRRTQELAALYEISLDITSQLDTQKLLQKIVRHAADLLGADGGTIDLYYPDAQELELVSASNQACRFIGTRLKVGEGLAGKVVQTGQPMTVEDYANWEGRSPQYDGVSFGSALAVPMEWQGQIIGALGVHEIGKKRVFTEEEVSLIRLLAAQAAVALQNARMYEDLKAAYERLQVAQEEVLKVERLRALGEMASGIVHDFNNTLTPMLGFLLMALRDPALPSQVRSDLEQVRQGVLDATRIVNRLREFYRPRDEEEPALLIGINQLIRDVVQSTRPQWHDAPKEQGITIHLSLQLGLVRSIRGHSADLQQMLMNLIANAVEAMPKGGTMSIRTRTDGDWVVMELADTGVGMPPEVKARLFEPFFTTKGEGHAGLGLATCYGVVKRHGGFIRVESRLGEGTWVTVRLPAAKEETPTNGNLEPVSDVTKNRNAAK